MLNARVSGSGGQVVAFTYDLPLNVICTRQENPANAAKSTATLRTTELTYLLDSPTDTWGRTWATSDFSNTNLRARVINIASSTARDFSLDWVATRVTYR
jgi:hypothetical protein